MLGSKRSVKRSWSRGRGSNSFRGECKYSIKRNKKFLNRIVRRKLNISNGNMYKKFAKEKAYQYVT